MYEGKYIKVISSKALNCEHIDNLSPSFFVINNLMVIPSTGSYRPETIRGVIDQAAFFYKLANQSLILELAKDYDLKEEQVKSIEILRVSIIAALKYPGCAANLRSLYQDNLDFTSPVFLKSGYFKLIEHINDQKRFCDEFIKHFELDANNQQTQEQIVEIGDQASDTNENSELTQTNTSDLPEHIKEYLQQIQLPDYDRLNEVGNQTALKEYKIYSTEFDKVIKAVNLLTPQERQKYSASLKQMIAKYVSKKNKNLQLLIKKLQAMTSYRFETGTNDGFLDNKRLATLLANPNGNVFKQQIKVENTSAAITILVDNSGSMRGSPIITSAAICYLLSKIFLEYKVKFEVIGFTTDTWRGGAVTKKWQADGYLPNPGRLNATMHIIYKAFNENHLNHNSLMANFSTMLKETILKENIDGEALEFAYNRISKTPEKNKILLVISDGAPLDDATCSANGGDYLEQHLKAVIAKIESTNKVKLLAVGINHDVGKYYQNSVNVENTNDLAEVIIKKLIELM